MFWYCNVCHAQNHETDGECQYCDCQGAECKRDNCSDPAHFLHFVEKECQEEDGVFLSKLKPSLRLYQPIAAYYWPDGEVSTAYYAAVFLRRGAGLSPEIIVTVPGV